MGRDLKTFRSDEVSHAASQSKRKHYAQGAYNRANGRAADHLADSGFWQKSVGSWHLLKARKYEISCQDDTQGASWKDNQQSNWTGDGQCEDYRYWEERWAQPNWPHGNAAHGYWDTGWQNSWAGNLMPVGRRSDCQGTRTGLKKVVAVNTMLPTLTQVSELQNSKGFSEQILAKHLAKLKPTAPWD